MFESPQPTTIACWHGGRGRRLAAPSHNKDPQGIRDTYDFDNPVTDVPSREMGRDMSRAAMLHDEEPSVLAALREDTLAKANQQNSTVFRHADGTSQTAHLHGQFRSKDVDEYTGEALPAAWVHAAIHK